MLHDTRQLPYDEFPCLGYRVECGRKVLAISGDTVDCPGLAQLATGADTLVACCYLARAEETDFEREVVSRHIIMGSGTVGKVAARAGVRRLVLTHLRRKSPALLKAIAREASADFPGALALGKDGLKLPLFPLGPE